MQFKIRHIRKIMLAALFSFSVNRIQMVSKQDWFCHLFIFSFAFKNFQVELNHDVTSNPFFVLCQWVQTCVFSSCAVLQAMSLNRSAAQQLLILLLYGPLSPSSSTRGLSWVSCMRTESFLPKSGEWYDILFSRQLSLLINWCNWTMLSLTSYCVFNYTAWSPFLELPAVFCRSSGRCCSTGCPCWAALTCYRLSPSTCSPFTTATAEVLHSSVAIGVALLIGQSLLKIVDFGTQGTTETLGPAYMSRAPHWVSACLPCWCSAAQSCSETLLQVIIQQEQQVVEWMVLKQYICFYMQ